MSQVCVPHPWPFLTTLCEGHFQLPRLTCRPSRSHWGVQMSAQRGRPPPVTAKHSDSHPPGKGRQRTEGGQSPPNPMQKGAPLTTGSGAGGPVLISMRFSGSSSSGASSGITTTGLMCSASAEARRKLGGPCRGPWVEAAQRPAPRSLPSAIPRAHMGTGQAPGVLKGLGAQSGQQGCGPAGRQAPRAVGVSG